ncbi:MAG TPA: hypothetical protein VE978_12525 [Chitinophagales bacterium]|nr:hypothetical protein [Chitinophagales bacterium]
MKAVKILLLSICFPAGLWAQSKENQVLKNHPDSILDNRNIGIGLGMTGRKIISFPLIYDTLPKILRVVVVIKADRKGNVISAKATTKGSTTSDPYLFQLAEDAALKTKVSADLSAEEEQSGTITYSFRVK